MVTTVTCNQLQEKWRERQWFIQHSFVTLEEFSAFLLKAVWGIDENLGYDLATVLNSTFCYEMHSMNTRR